MIDRPAAKVAPAALLSKSLSVVAALCLIVFAAGAAFSPSAVAEEITVEHELGTTTLTQNPRRVIVFDFGVLDSLDKLGIDVIGLPKASLPPYLSSYESDQYQNVGSLVEPDFEAIVRLEPDLIIISGRQSSHYEELSRIAPTVYLGIDATDYIGSLKHNMNTLGSIFNVEATIGKELALIDAQVESVKEQASGKTAMVVLVTGGKANTYGPGSRYGFIFDVLGFMPVDDRIVATTHGQNISFEYILVYDPDYIFVIDRDAAIGEEGSQPAKAVMENALVKATRAYQNGNIAYLDPHYWYLSGGGLASFPKMIEDIEKALQ